MYYHEKFFKSELRMYKVGIVIKPWSDCEYKLEIELKNENGQKLDVYKKTVYKCEYEMHRSEALDKIANQCIKEYEDWSVESWEE